MSGRRCTYITPVYCGHALDYLTQKLPIGGQQVTDALTKVLLLLACHCYPAALLTFQPRCRWG
jgi:actin-related protein